ncbi:hypothetical protein Pcinc_031970 [Petrolisthes cinctipes]|uniref:PHD-type domain-containing protein n=1 Tax=Petrolisthes cinctipes TaxID=88211 RepID=A0AAE1EVT0_PETCI|nr:hypothetical protein Pcinc_031970 [Petrolisthes cinctipes]
MADFCLVCQSTVRPRQEGLLCNGCNLWQHRTCGSGISRDQYRTAVKQGAEIDWMCQFCIIKEKANEEENFEGANFEAMSDNMEVSLVSSENLEFFEGDVANNMQASAVSSNSLENFEGASFEELLSSNMEASAVSGAPTPARYQCR